MNPKKLLFALLLIFVFCGAGKAFAMTDAEKQALIVQIQQQIAQLTAQVNQILAQQQGTTSWCYTFNSNLGFAQSGTNDVDNLHTALQKSGIYFSPDGAKVYSTATSNGVKQFQAKYSISQSGYVGNLTRAKLNQLYGCSAVKINSTSCTPNWQCTAWSICSSNQQTRTCADYNYCGTLSGQPLSTQTCNQNDTVVVDDSCNATCSVQSNGIFAVDCDATVTKCDSGDVCRKVYDTTYTYNNGGVQETKTLTGAECMTPDSCIPDWYCTGFGSCVNGQQTQTCTDNNNCGVLTDKPDTVQSCNVYCTPNWYCSGFDGKSCLNGEQTQTCTDTNGCGTTEDRPDLTQSCVVAVDDTCNANCLTQSDGIFAVDCDGSVTKCDSGETCQKDYDTKYTYLNGSIQTTIAISGSECVASTACVPNWSCSGFGSCVNGQQTQTCTDTNSCGTTENRPDLTQSCTVCNANCYSQSDGTYSVDCDGSITKCDSGETCQKTYDTSYTYNNGTIQTITTLTGSECVSSSQ